MFRHRSKSLIDVSQAISSTGMSKNPLAGYRAFATSTWGSVVNIVILVSPANLAVQLGFGKGFIPIYGDPVFATGLSTFLSIFVVLAMFTAREGIYDMSDNAPVLFWLIFLATFASGVGLLAFYIFLHPTYELGAFLYGGAFIGFSAAFHLLAVREYVSQQPEKKIWLPEATALDVGKRSIARAIGSEKLRFTLTSQDSSSWSYIVADDDSVPQRRYTANINRLNGDVSIKEISESASEKYLSSRDAARHLR
jgi:hypothetical protein